MYNIGNCPTKIDQKAFHRFCPPFFGIELHFYGILHFVVFNMLSVHSMRETKLKLLQLNSPFDIYSTGNNDECMGSVSLYSTCSNECFLLRIYMYDTQIYIYIYTTQQILRDLLTYNHYKLVLLLSFVFCSK